MLLLYKDNGVGFPERFEMRTVKSLGMKLIYNLAVKQLRGDAELLFEDEPDSR